MWISFSLIHAAVTPLGCRNSAIFVFFLRKLLSSIARYVGMVFVLVKKLLDATLNIFFPFKKSSPIRFHNQFDNFVFSRFSYRTWTLLKTVEASALKSLVPGLNFFIKKLIRFYSNVNFQNKTKTESNFKKLKKSCTRANFLNLLYFVIW